MVVGFLVPQKSTILFSYKTVEVILSLISYAKLFETFIVFPCHMLETNISSALSSLNMMNRLYFMGKLHSVWIHASLSEDVLRAFRKGLTIVIDLGFTLKSLDLFLVQALSCFRQFLQIRVVRLFANRKLIPVFESAASNRLSLSLKVKINVHNGTPEFLLQR